MNHEQLVRTLQSIVGMESVIASADEKLVYEYDASFDSHVPDVVVLPATAVLPAPDRQFPSDPR